MGVKSPSSANAVESQGRGSLVKAEKNKATLVPRQESGALVGLANGVKLAGFQQSFLSCRMHRMSGAGGVSLKNRHHVIAG